MRKKEQLYSEIKKMRKLLNSAKTTDSDKDKLWCAMLCLQWALSPRVKDVCPTDICVPNWRQRVRLK